MAQRDHSLLGPVLIIVGVLLLLGELDVPGFPLHWPLLLIAVGVGFLLRWTRDRSDSSRVFTATLLILLGLMFQWDAWFELNFGRVWPFFPFAAGCAFCARGVVDRKDGRSIGLGLFLIAFSLVMWVVASDIFRSLVKALAGLVATLVRVAIPLGLIVWGSWLLFGRRSGLGRKQRDVPEKLEPPASIRSDPEGDENIPATD